MLNETTFRHRMARARTAGAGFQDRCLKPLRHLFNVAIREGAVTPPAARAFKPDRISKQACLELP